MVGMVVGRGGKEVKLQRRSGARGCKWMDKGGWTVLAEGQEGWLEVGGVRVWGERKGRAEGFSTVGATREVIAAGSTRGEKGVWGCEGEAGLCGIGEGVGQG